MNKGVANAFQNLAGRLIRSDRKGVEAHNTSRCEELKERLGGIVGTIIDAPVNKIQVALRRHRARKVLCENT